MLDYKEYDNIKNTDKLIRLIKNDGFDAFLSIVKMIGLTINQYGNKPKYSKIINQLDDYIHVNMNEREIVKWKIMLNESNHINKIYSKFNNNPLFNIVKTDNPIESFLLVTEKLLYYIINIIDNKEDNNTLLELNFDKFYPQYSNIMDKRQRFMQLHDQLTIVINDVLASLKFYEYPNQDIHSEETLKDDELKCSFNHFNKVQINNILNYVTTSWKFGGRKIKQENDKICFDIQGEVDEDFFIINERSNSRENKIYLEILQFIKDTGKSYPIGKKITEYIDIYEYSTCLSLMIYLNADNLQECKCRIFTKGQFEVSVRELIRAYFVLINYGKKFLEYNFKRENRLDSWGIIVSKDSLIQLFAEYDIDYETISVIIKSLTYRKNVDIFDAPLIEIKNESFLIMPHFLIGMDVSKLVLSIVDEIDNRGTLFEKSILDNTKHNKIECKSLYFKEGIDEYQCDIAFIIANDLYICECKAWNQFKNIKGYYDMKIKMYEAKNQLDRIANKYEERIDIVNERFGYLKEHQFNNITKLVITLNMQGLQRKFGETYFVDESCLIKFFDREKPGISEYGKHRSKIYFKGYEEYEGKITNYKFMSMLKLPANIEVTRKNRILSNNQFIIDGLNIQIPMFIREHETTRFIHKDNLYQQK